MEPRDWDRQLQDLLAAEEAAENPDVDDAFMCQCGGVDFKITRDRHIVCWGCDILHNDLFEEVDEDELGGDFIE